MDILQKVLAIMLMVFYSAIQPMPVSAATLSIVVSPASGPPGTQVTVSGDGFTSGSAYVVRLGATLIEASGSVSTGGHVEAIFNIPVLPRGIYQISLTTTSDNTALGFVNFTVTPQISVSDTTGGVTDKIGISGSGFNPNQTITFLIDYVAFASVNSDAQGTFSNTQVTLPSLAVGNHTIIAEDLSGRSPGVNFVVSSTIILSTDQATVGSEVNISGTGFKPSSNVYIYFDDVFNASVKSDSHGGFDAFVLTVPVTFGGTHTINVKDELSNSITTNLIVTPSITVNPDNGPPETQVTITGHGFIAIAHSPITITYDGTIVVTNPDTINADGSGNFIGTFNIPAESNGGGIIKASDSSTSCETKFTTLAPVTGRVEPATGTPGIIITVSGSGFKDNERLIIRFSDSPVGSTITNDEGAFTATLVTPDYPSGDHKVTITGSESMLGLVFTVIPSMTIVPDHGNPGDEVTIMGTGFAKGKEINVYYDAENIALNRSDLIGNFDLTFKVPAGDNGVHRITVTDGINNKDVTFVSEDSIAPPTTRLISPEPTTKVTDTLVMIWQNATDPSGVTYTLQVATNDTFHQIVFEKVGLTASVYQVGQEEMLNLVSKDTPYYWRVKTVDGVSNESEWSTPSTFYIVSTIFRGWIWYAIGGGGVIIVIVLIIGLVLLTKRRD